MDNTRGRNNRRRHVSQETSNACESYAGIEAPDLKRIGWNRYHRNSRCPKLCQNDEDHCRIWISTYRNVLEQLFSTFNRRITSGRPNQSKVTFSEFAEFAYLSSSGYISPHVN